MINREGYYVTDTERECTNCGTIFEKKSKTVTLCNPCNSERVKSNSPEYKMLARAKRRAKESNREFLLDLNDLTIPEYCPILGMKMEVFSGRSGGEGNSPSLDRKDSSKGYTKDNIQIISQRANVMKNNASIEEMKLFAKWVFETFGTD